VPGTAVFLTAAADAAPHALLHNLNHNKVLHERVVFLTLEVREQPLVEPAQRIALERLEHGFWRMTLRYGFMQRPDVAYDLTETSRRILPFDLMTTSFFLSRQIIVPAGGGGRLGRWSLRAFAAMVGLAGNAADYMNLPPNRVIELGTKVQI